ncbi:hypothetical protein JEQ12_012337 [Ovis aries]|uniref:Uncharacterized protein n=1 Tax=Ovis aries TaxID=9940 RepID=A0A835ZSX5_SHEEP|nr:hypothetical protein JEQ12_012337 [Ovis aries]
MQRAARAAGGGPAIPASSAAAAPGRPARGQLSHPGAPRGWPRQPWAPAACPQEMCVGPCGRAPAPERCQAGHPTRRGGHTALSTLPAVRLGPPTPSSKWPAAAPGSSDAPGFHSLALEAPAGTLPTATQRQGPVPATVSSAAPGRSLIPTGTREGAAAIAAAAA